LMLSAPPQTLKRCAQLGDNRPLGYTSSRE
jgi:hypothetical protein